MKYQTLKKGKEIEDALKLVERQLHEFDRSEEHLRLDKIRVGNRINESFELIITKPSKRLSKFSQEREKLNEWLVTIVRNQIVSEMNRLKKDLEELQDEPDEPDETGDLCPGIEHERH